MAVIEAIQTTYLEASASSVTFSSIPSSYEYLQLRWSAKSDRGIAGEQVGVRFNSDTGANYHNHSMYAVSTTVETFLRTGNAYIDTWGIQGFSDSASFGSGIVDIPDYAEDGNKNTSLFTFGGAGDQPLVAFGGGMWDNTDDVTIITLHPVNSSNFVRGSEFTLYGLNSS